MSINFQEILKELEYRVEHGIIDLTKEEQVTKLTQILRESNVSNANEISQKVRVYYSYLNEIEEAGKKQKADIDKILNQTFKNPETGNMVKVASALGYDKKSQAYKTAKGMFASAGFSEKDIDMIDTAPGDEEVPVAKPNTYGKDKGATLGAGDYELDIEKDKKSKPGQQYLSKTGTQEMESKDGSSFEGYKSGKLKAPGTPAGAFAEVGGLKIAGYLREHPNATDEELTKYISNWAKTGKVTKQPKVSGGDKLTAAVHTGRAIFEKINQVASEEGYDPKTTTAEGYWGDKESLIHAQQRVDEIAKKNPKATFNGYSAEEYKKIIAANGAGENPTDSMVIIWDGKSNNVSLLHVSNKIGSNNIQANSTVSQTYERAQNMIESSSLNPAEKDAATKSIAKRKLNGVKLQKQQIDYQLSFVPKYAKLASNPKALKELTADIYGDSVRRGDAVDGLYTGKGGIVAGCSKLAKAGKSHPSCKMIDNPKATPQQKVAGMFAFYAKHPELKAPGAVRQIISRTAVIQDDSGKPKYKTGYDSGVINTLYGKMNNEVEGMRQDLNKIQNGLGDRMMTHDFASRLHLTIAEGHNPGGIPANRFQLIMGNNEADIWYDKNQQAYQKVKNQFYKVLDDGSLDKKPTTLSQKEVNRGNIATIGDVDNFQHCLGVPKGKTIDNYMNVKYDKINTKTGIQSAHIFDINGREIGIMTIRTKSGPGGDANDTLQFSKDMQNCMQKQEYLKKRKKK